jgi:hypothetical protein
MFNTLSTIEKINIIEWLPYVFLVLGIIILTIYSYIRIKYGFWVVQPVFHVYDFGYYLYPPGIINHKLPDKNKYTNFKNIETIDFSKLSDIKLTQFLNFININFLQDGDNIFCPKRENIVPYFTGHPTKSFISMYTEDNLLLDTKDGTTISDKKIIGVMTTRPIHVLINNYNKNTNNNKFDAYYVDYLCVDLFNRKKGIAPQIIQTHEYNQRHTNKNMVVSLFKREDELTGIVPLCVYSTYGFPVTKWTKPMNLSAEYSLLEISPQNFHKVYDFIKENNANFDIVISVDIPNIIELIKTKNIFMNAILCDDKIICAYFFRKSCVFVEKDMEVLSCFGSINDGLDEDIFIQGFKISFWNIADKNNFGFCAIENISHNNVIINNLLIKTHPSVVSPTAYFFYNFAYYSFKHEKVLIIY